MSVLGQYNAGSLSQGVSCRVCKILRENHDAAGVDKHHLGSATFLVFPRPLGNPWPLVSRCDTNTPPPTHRWELTCKEQSLIDLMIYTLFALGNSTIVTIQL